MTWTFPRFSPARALLLWSAALAVGALQGLAMMGAMESLAAAQIGPPGATLSAESLFWIYMAGASGCFGALPIALFAADNFPCRRPLLFLLLHGCAASLFAFCSIALTRLLVFALAALDGRSLSLPPLFEMVLFDCQNTLPLYAGVTMARIAQREQALSRAAENQAAALKLQLAEARIDTLHAQLQPSRIFAELAAARDCLPHDAAGCERTIQALADELRRATQGERRNRPPATSRAAYAVRALEPLAIRRWIWPELHVRQGLRLLPIVLAIALLIAATIHLARPDLTAVIYLGSVGRAVGAWLGLPIVRIAAVNVAVARGLQQQVRRVAILLLAFMAFCVVWVVASDLVRLALSSALQLPLPNVSLWHGFLIETQRLTFVFAALVGYFGGAELLRRRHEEEQRVAQLRAVVAESELAALNARIDPHFLYNALHTLSELVHHDAAHARGLIEGLEELLHVALSSVGAEWSLREERHITERFVAFLHARFGQRIRVEWHLDTPLLSTPVPRLALQTLVENAVKHNVTRRQPLAIQIEARSCDEVALLVVSDDGRGFGNERAQSHHGGLQRLAQTLHLLHGAAAALVTSSVASRGARVELRIPYAKELSC